MGLECDKSLDCKGSSSSDDAEMLLLCPLNSICCKYIFVPSYAFYFNCLLFSCMSIYVFFYSHQLRCWIFRENSQAWVFFVSGDPLKEMHRYVVLATCMEENILLVWLNSLNFFFSRIEYQLWCILKKKGIKNEGCGITLSVYTFQWVMHLSVTFFFSVDWHRPNFVRMKFFFKYVSGWESLG